MSRHFSALLLSMIHKKILISAFLMHIDVSINRRKGIHENIFSYLNRKRNVQITGFSLLGRNGGSSPLHQPKLRSSGKSWKSTRKIPRKLPGKLPGKSTPVGSPHQIFIPSPPKVSPPQLELGSTTLVDLYLLTRKP